LRHQPNPKPGAIAKIVDQRQRFSLQVTAPGETERVFVDSFAIFPRNLLPPHAEWFDLGCGSGCWSSLVAPRAGRLHCIDPSNALAVARHTLADQPIVQFHQASVAVSGLPPNSQDLAHSLGEHHHVRDSAAGLPADSLPLSCYCRWADRPALFAACTLLVHAVVQGNLIEHSLTPPRL